MRHSYLNKRDIYFASSQKHITSQESRELIKQLDECRKRVMSRESVSNLNSVRIISAYNHPI